MSKKFLKSIAVITSTLFIATNLSWANLSNSEPLRSETPVHAPITSIQIPEVLGTIQDQHISKSGSPFVVLIQDAHAVTEAQTQIQKLIQYLGEKYGISLAALEGTSGKMDATLLRAFPDEKVKEKVLSDYLSRGEITGAEMAAVFNAYHTEFFGIEDMKLYEDNYFAYLTAVRNQKSIFASLEKLKSELDNRRKTVYSVKQNEFYLQVESFRTGKTSILDLLKYFREFDLKKYPNLKKICDLSDKEITKKNIRQVSDIKGTELFGEMETFISETENSFCNNQEQKEIVQAYRQNALLHDLASLELTKEQWSTAKEAPREFASAADFYRLALRRDDALHANLNQLLTKRKIKSVIVIAGGFHAEGFKEALKKSGYSYAVVLPALHSANGHENYAGLMQGNLSYKQYLKTSLYDAFLKDASIKLSRALDSRDASMKMKYWRDEVIRATAREGRVGDSEKYTRYIDSLNTKSREEILSAVKKVLDSFLAENLQKIGMPVPSVAKSSALAQLAHPLMPTQSNRLRDFVLTEEFSANSLGMPQEMQVLIDEIKRVDPVTFAQRIQGLKWDSGQVYSLRIGINPGLVEKGLRLDRRVVSGNRKTYAQVADWWSNNNNITNARTNNSVRKNFRPGVLKLLDDNDRLYFAAPGPEGGDFSWFEAHHILHDIFLTTITPQLREEFLDLVLEARKEGIEKNIRERLRPDNGDYFTPTVDVKNDVFGLNHRLSENPLSDPDSMLCLSEMFARLGGDYLGYQYKGDRSLKVDVKKFHPFFDKIKLRASEGDLKALLTSLTATGRSLGEGKTPGSGGFKINPDLLRGPPIEEPTLSTIIRSVIDFDKLVYGLTVDSLRQPGVMLDLEKHLEHEKIIYHKIEKTTTDDGKSLPVILEQAETLMFDHRQVNIGMISVPISGAAAVGKEFGLDESKEAHKPGESEAFEDVLKRNVADALVRAAHPGANFEDPDRPQNAYLGGRIVIPNVDSAWLSTNLNSVIKNVKDELKKQYEEKIIENMRNNPDNQLLSELEFSQRVLATLTDFRKKVDGLDFHASQVLVHLKPEGEVKVKSFEIKDVEERLNEIKQEKLKGKNSFDPNAAKTVKERNELFALIDDFQSEQRLHYAVAARYWIDHEHEPNARANASHFLELLLEDAVKKLNERLEFIEKVTSDGLKRVIQAEMKRKKARMDVLDNESVRKIKETLVHSDEGGLRSQLFQDFYSGRQKTIPLFNRYTGRLPRLLSRLHDVYNEEDPEESLLPSLDKAFDELKKDFNNSNPGVLESRLEIFKKNYKAYRKGGEKVTPHHGKRNLRGFNEILAAAYCDPRLQRIYKLFWMDEVLDADSKGLLEEWRNHLASHRQGILANRIEPGLFLFKRPVGDEVGFLIKDSDGKYQAAFAELNKGNAYFSKYTPDSRDLIYHEILLRYFRAAIDFKKSGKAKDHPLGVLGFLEGLDDVIRKAASESFPDIEKVKLLDKPLERMYLYEIDGMRYAKARDGKVYVQAFKPGPWLPTDEIIPEALKPIETTLSAARTVRSEPVVPGRDKMKAVFVELDYDNYEQKKDPKLIHQVVTTDQIRNKPSSTRRYKLPKKIEGSSLGQIRAEDIARVFRGQKPQDELNVTGKDGAKYRLHAVAMHDKAYAFQGSEIVYFNHPGNDVIRIDVRDKKGKFLGHFLANMQFHYGVNIINSFSSTLHPEIQGQGIAAKVFEQMGKVFPSGTIVLGEPINVPTLVALTKALPDRFKYRPLVAKFIARFDAIVSQKPSRQRDLDLMLMIEPAGKILTPVIAEALRSGFSIPPSVISQTLLAKINEKAGLTSHELLTRGDGGSVLLLASWKPGASVEQAFEAMRAAMRAEAEGVEGSSLGEQPSERNNTITPEMAQLVIQEYSKRLSGFSAVELKGIQRHVAGIHNLLREIVGTSTLNQSVKYQEAFVKLNSLADSISVQNPMLHADLVRFWNAIRQFVDAAFAIHQQHSNDLKAESMNEPFSRLISVLIEDYQNLQFRMSDAIYQIQMNSHKSDGLFLVIGLMDPDGKLFVSTGNPGSFLDVSNERRLKNLKGPMDLDSDWKYVVIPGVKVTDQITSESVNVLPKSEIMFTDHDFSDGSSLGSKVGEIYQRIVNAYDIAAYVASPSFETSVTSRLGVGANLLISRIRAVVKGSEAVVLPVQLSLDAKFLLANPKILADALKNKHGINFNAKSDYVIDASFLHQPDAVKFIQQLGESAAVTFASGTPDADLTSRLLHGTRRVGYAPNNVLEQKKLGKMDNPTLILPRDISFKFTEGSDWKKRGVEAEPALVNPYETSEFVRLVEIILQTRKLKDNGVSFPVIDQEMLNSVVVLLNNLAKEELTREALGRAA